MKIKRGTGMANNENNNTLRNFIDCVLVVLVLFFGYHYFTAPKAEPKDKSVVEQQDLFEKTGDKTNAESEKEKEAVPSEMFDLMKN